MKKKYLYIYLIVLIIATFSTGFVALKIGDDYFTEKLFDQMARQNKLINVLYQDEHSGELPIDPQAFAKAQGENIDARITIIDEEGVVLADSEFDPAEMENHLFRPEVQQALKNGVGMASRWSDTLKVDFYYVASLIETDGETQIIRHAIPLKDFRDMNERVLLYTGFAIVISAIAVSLIAFVLFQQYRKTVVALTESAEQISAGNYGRTLLIESDDEMKSLVQAFNQMSMELKNKVAELKGQNIKLEATLNSMVNGLLAVDPEGQVLFSNKHLNEMLDTEVKEGDGVYQTIRSSSLNHMIQKVIETKGPTQSEVENEFRQDQVLRFFANPIYLEQETELYGILFLVQDITSIRKLERMRSDFIANVSHELKTPITSIRGFIETIRAGSIQDPKQLDRFLHIIDQESERLYSLVQDILSLSEIETMDQDFAKQNFPLRPLCEEVIHLLKSVAQEKGIELAMDWQGDCIEYFGNRDRIKQVLINLLDNGIKYTDQGRVDLRVKTNEKWIRIEVEDTGIGFDEEHHVRIFERFYRVDKGRSRKRGGTGLGLSIVKNIVLRENGNVSVRSKEGQGACFIIDLPITKNSKCKEC